MTYSRSFAIPELDLVFCNCGYSGEVEPAFEDLDRLSDEVHPFGQPPLPPKKLVCPICEISLTYELDSRMFTAKNILDFATFYDNSDKNKISLSIGFTSYYFNEKKSMKISAKSHRVRFTFNTVSKQLYVCWNGKVSNASRGNFKVNSCRVAHDLMFDLLSTFRIPPVSSQGMVAVTQKSIYSDSPYAPDVKTFIDTIVSISLPYMSPESFYYIRSISNLMKFVRYPQLQQLSIEDVAKKLTFEFNEKQPSFEKKLKKATKTKDLWTLMLGRSEKGLIKAAHDSNAISTIQLFGSLFKDVNNVQKVLEQEHTKRLQSKRSVFLSNNVNFFELTDFESYQSSWQWFLSLNGHNENVAVNKFISFYQKSTVYGAQTALYHIRDSYSSYQSIQYSIERQRAEGIDVSYEVVFNGDIAELHDTLSRDLSRFRNPNMTFKYSEQEHTRLERVIDDASFYLPTCSHELVDIGTRMDICVGGYGERVFNKHCLIVMATINEIEVCIELRLDKEGIPSIAQAKTAYNKLPSQEIADVIVQWAEEAGINSTNFDMQYASYQSVTGERLLISIPEIPSFTQFNHVQEAEYAF